MSFVEFEGKAKQNLVISKKMSAWEACKVKGTYYFS